MTSNQKLAQAVYELYKKGTVPCPACVVLAADSQYTKFELSNISHQFTRIPETKKLYEATTSTSLGR